MIKIILPLLLLLFGFFIPVKVLADVSISLNPNPVTENTPTATITFSNLVPGTKYYFTSVQGGSGNKQSMGNIVASSSSYSMTVCGAENNFLKTNCGSGDFFKINKTYKVLISVEKGGTLDEIGNIQFNAEPATSGGGSTDAVDVNLTNSGNTFTISIIGSRNPPDDEDRNRYDFDLSGEAPDGTKLNTSDPADLTVPTDGRERTFTLNQNGVYTLTVRFDKENSVIKTFTIEKTDGGIKITETTGNRLKGPQGTNPCSTGTGGKCETALGDIPTTATGFAQKVLSIGLGLGGGLALIFMVYGSIRILVSTGDPKKISEGREIIVAAVAGLLFIIFSVIILRFIGVSILPSNPFT